MEATFILKSTHKVYYENMNSDLISIRPPYCYLTKPHLPETKLVVMSALDDFTEWKHFFS